MSIIYINPFQFAAAAPPSGYDPDAQAYITAVEAADGQSLEVGVKDAINTFFVGCKADGIFSALKASCILAGARTLSGALVPLVSTMPAPTNYNFVAADYNRKIGLKGQGGSTKYLNTNRAENADPQNNSHISVYATETVDPASTATYIGVFDGSTVLTEIINAASTIIARMRNLGGAFLLGSSLAQGTSTLLGASRSAVTSFNIRITGNGYTQSTSSVTPSSLNITVFARNNPTGVTNVAGARISFYSIGESLDLALLDARLSALMSDLAAAIP